MPMMVISHLQHAWHMAPAPNSRKTLLQAAVSVMRLDVGPELLGLRVPYVLAMVGVPLLFGSLLALRARYGQSTTLALVSAFATVGYRREPALLQAWECVVLARKLLVLLIVTLLRPAGLQVQLIAGDLLLVAALAAHLRAQPHADQVVQEG